ncbi:MAG: hypothetical protein J6Y85_03845 [Alphaproteobacteria bacterium]|nr:hypothetical protein [Alphaproteobacteria bacterium]
MKNVFLFLIMVVWSCSTFASDREPTNRACPDGTYRSSGRMGAGCCTKDRLYIYGSDYQYVDVSPKGCGCPKGGKPTNDGFGCCSEDGYAFDPYDSMKYDKYQPALCCPFGGERASTGECCKDNYEYNEETKKYDLINGHCGCPKGSTPAQRTWGGDLYCCKDGQAQRHSYNGIWPELCGCPKNGTPVIKGEGESDICCTPDHLYRWSSADQAYSDWCPTCCGCPDGGVAKSRPDRFGSVSACCKWALALDPKTKQYTGFSSACIFGEVR